MKRYLMIFDTYLVLFDREDGVAFRTGKDPETQCPIHKDDVADAIFLFDQETEWCRIQKDRILIDNRSRTLKLEFKTEPGAMEVLLGSFSDSIKAIATTHSLSVRDHNLLENHVKHSML